MKTNSRKSKQPAEAKTSQAAQRKGDYVQRLVMLFKCDRPSDRVNIVGRTRQEQRQADRDAKANGLLWGNLESLFGPYRPRWKRELRGVLLKTANALKV